MLERITATVPPELKERFSDVQLKNSIYRIRILTVIALLAKLINAIFYLRLDESLQDGRLFIASDCAEVLCIAVFNVIIGIFGKKNNKQLLWGACYITIAAFFVIYAYQMSFVDAVSQVPFMFFVTMFLFVVIPDFKPAFFITCSTLYYITTALVLFRENQFAGDYFGLQSHILNIFLIVLVTKILLYNSKVKTYVNTYKINELNAQLANYSDNLERMVQAKTETIVGLKNAVMETISELVERRDNATGGHITRTSLQLKILISALLESGQYKEQTCSWNIEQMILSAQLHDVGKIAIDDSILRKPAKLTEDEFEVIKTHTSLGGEIIKEIQQKTNEREFLDYASIFAVYHHEKWDGTGYPYGLSGESIPLPARLMAIVDVYDALISERPYKKPITHEEAIKIIAEGKGTHFDPHVTDLFLSVSEQLIENG